MPIYEYQCDACGHAFEAIQKISEPKLTDCDSCGQSSLRKKVSAAGFRLKGGGWYETDFKASGKKNLAGEGAAPAATLSGGGSADSGGTSDGGGSSGGSAGGKTSTAAPGGSKSGSKSGDNSSTKSSSKSSSNGGSGSGSGSSSGSAAAG